MMFLTPQPNEVVELHWKLLIIQDVFHLKNTLETAPFSIYIYILAIKKKVINNIENKM